MFFNMKYLPAISLADATAGEAVAAASRGPGLGWLAGRELPFTMSMIVLLILLVKQYITLDPLNYLSNRVICHITACLNTAVKVNADEYWNIYATLLPCIGSCLSGRYFRITCGSFYRCKLLAILRSFIESDTAVSTPWPYPGRHSRMILLWRAWERKPVA